MDERNLADLHRHQAERWGPRPALVWRQDGLFRDQSWADYYRDSRAVAAALAAAGVAAGDRVGLLAENRREWLIADLGILAAGAVNVPAHATLSAKQVQYQFAHAGIRWLFVSTAEQWAKLQPLLAELPDLRGAVLFEGPAPEGVLTWAGLLTRGRRLLAEQAAELDRRRAALGPDDLATLMYTSGTTGNPKGVMLTHGNLLSNAVALVESAGFGSDNLILAWLPWSHIYGRLCDHYVHLVEGSTLALATAQETLLDDLRDVAPTCLSAVPRFYEKVLTATGGDAAKLRKVFGPRIRWLSAGGAPLPPHVAEAFVAAGLEVLQGYGLTESSPVISFNRPGANRVGTVGPALPGVEIRLGPDGEVLTRGPHVMRGYWQDPAATAAALRDGWLHTGDLGHLDADGYLSITGRKKDLLVMSNGKKVVPTYLEGLLTADPCIDQALVYGEGKNFLTALIVPHFAKLREAAEAKGVSAAADADLVLLPDVQALMARRIAAAMAEVAPWERVQKFILLERAFSQEAEEVTVSLKIRRGVIFDKHRAALEALYR